MSLAPMQNACCCFYNLLNNLLVKHEKDITERLYTVMKCIVVFICIIIGVKSWEIEINGPSSVQLGNTLSLTCKATHLESPPKTVVWHKGYTKVESDNRTIITIILSPNTITSKLTINHVQPEDAGKYKCWVSNEIIRHFTVAVVDRTSAGCKSLHYSSEIQTFAVIMLVLCFL
ncbi:uncharacterized protein LOC132756956 [Ruditapes philippinarum]|uniref:uncharacterized protein LOC132756956 n=1 Tax=Ruditapes philippinarum TaxID=129788 RepID=UPI00295BBF1C|nr:uncharacterized protein LOC132756956 [Ruditapes philippinarum]